MALLTLPGLIDPHVHLRDPGQTEKEDFYTGTQAALHGGYTTLLDMPNNLLPITSLERLEEKITSAKEKIVCDVGFYFGSLGDNLDQFSHVQNTVFGLKIFLNHTTGDYIINETELTAIYTAWPGNRPILVHAEEKAVEMVINIVRKTKKRTHICHIASRFELNQVIMAKEQGLPITCGVTPHHLFLNENDEKHLGPLGKMRPPLKSRKDVDFLWNHLPAIDMIESDHAPHTLDEKHSDKPPYGVLGLETTLPLLLTAVAEEKLTIADVIRLCHTGPARCFGVVTRDNTSVTVELSNMYEMKNENLLSKAKWTPFDGWKMKGSIRLVTLRGKTVFQDGIVLAAPGSGHLLTPGHL